MGIPKGQHKGQHQGKQQLQHQGKQQEQHQRQYQEHQNNLNTSGCDLIRNRLVPSTFKLY